jgi:quercetin dioxygenase-like cupin family protein
MKVININEKVGFLAEDVKKQLLHDSDPARYVLFCLEEGQEIEPHTSSSTVTILVLDGKGKWLGGEEIEFNKGDICFYEPEEPHGFRAEKRSVLLAVIAPSPV